MTQSEVLAELAADEAKLKPYWTVPEPARAQLLLKAPDLLALINESPFQSKYHGHHGFEADRFLTDYEAWRVKVRALIAEIEGGGS